MKRNFDTDGSWEVISRHFEDPEELSEAAGCWDLDFRQLDSGRFDAHLFFAMGPALMVTRCHLGRQMEQEGGAPAGALTFAVPMQDNMQIRWRGLECDGRNIMLYRPGSEIASVTDDRFSVITVSVPPELFLKTVESEGYQLESVLGRGPDVRSYSKEKRLRLRRALSQLVDSVVSPHRFPRLFFPADQERELLSTILDAWIDSSSHIPRSMTPSRSNVLVKALDIIQSHADEPISMADLERLSGASLRTLRYAFQEKYGISPKQYLQSFRLDRARRRLIQLRDERSPISEAANEWGFWHMGQFAADYRRLFGELPSETLQRRNQPGIS